VRQDAHRAHDQLRELYRSFNQASIKGADAALRAALLINGGAAVSVLAFIYGFAAQNRVQPDQLKHVASSLEHFSFGVVASVIGMALAYLTNYATAAHTNSFERQWEPPYIKPSQNTRKLRRLKNGLHVIAVAAGVGSVAYFVCGMFDVRQVISHLK
jgi:hypothetical protein